MAFSVITAQASFNRPADTNAYSSGDLVANSTIASSVVPLSFTVALTSGGSFIIRRARLKKSDLSIINAKFVLHLYGTDPSVSFGIATGDNGAWSTKEASYLGSFTLDMTGANGRVFTDSAKVIAPSDQGTEIDHKLPTGTAIYGLLATAAAYSPATSETFTVELEVIQT